jgi:hypothetical protein
MLDDYIVEIAESHDDDADESLPSCKPVSMTNGGPKYRDKRRHLSS